jgi:hypothetical protein
MGPLDNDYQSRFQPPQPPIRPQTYPAHKMPDLTSANLQNNMLFYFILNFNI